MKTALFNRHTDGRRKLLAGALAVTMVGCVNMSGLSGSPRYACQAPEGVACQSVSGTYANTAGPRETRAALASAQPSPGAEFGSAGTLAPALSATIATSPPTNLTEDGLPLRAAPRVLRLWIKPWEDADGDLHDQGHVYVQIDDGRWQIDHLQRRIRDAVAPARPLDATVSPPRPPAQLASPPPTSATPGQRFPATPAGRPPPLGTGPAPDAMNAAPALPGSSR